MQICIHIYIYSHICIHICTLAFVNTYFHTCCDKPWRAIRSMLNESRTNSTPIRFSQPSSIFAYKVSCGDGFHVRVCVCERENWRHRDRESVRVCVDVYVCGSAEHKGTLVIHVDKYKAIGDMLCACTDKAHMYMRTAYPHTKSTRISTSNETCHT